MSEGSTPEIPLHTHNELLIKNLREALIISKDPEVNKKLELMLEMVEGLENYLEDMSPPETELQQKIYRDTLLEPWANHFGQGRMASDLHPCIPLMMSSRHSSQFLKIITEISNAKKVLEIGMLTGYSAAVFCSVQSVVEVTSLEYEPFLVNFTKERFNGTPEGKKHRIIQGPALESLETLKNNGETFDVVFVDADKPNYLNYYKSVMDLIGSGGVILLDNTLWRGELYPEPKTERARLTKILNDFIAQDERVDQVILQICDGVSLIRRK